MLVGTSGLSLSRSLLDHLPLDLGVLGLGSPSGRLWAFWPVYSVIHTLGPKDVATPKSFLSGFGL